MASIKRLSALSFRCARRSVYQANMLPLLQHQVGIRRPLIAPTISRSFKLSFSNFARHLAEYTGSGNAELAAKLDSELSLEQEMRDSDALPAHLKEFIDNAPFELTDVPGSEEVILTRKLGDESIRVSFSIADLNNIDEESDFQEGALEDEFEDTADVQNGDRVDETNRGAINRGGRANSGFRSTTEDSVSAIDNVDTVQESSQSTDESEPSFPARLVITIERQGKGALELDAIAQDGLIVIDNLYFFKDPKLADPQSPTEIRSAEQLYKGPPFANLDEDLQVLFENYLSERGINTTLALFVPEYIDYKEQREYLTWLEGVKGFIA